MENSEVAQSEKIKPQQKVLSLTPEEKKQLVSFFSLLIEIDQRNRKKKQ